MNVQLQDFLLRCADRIDATLRKSNVDGTVVGGCIHGHTLRFDIAVKPGVSVQQVAVIGFWHNVQRVYRLGEFVCIEMNYGTKREATR